MTSQDHAADASDTGPRATIVAREDGPLVVSGPVSLDDGTGLTEVERVFLCRCGHSGDKPLCDGTHKRNGFTAPGVPVPRKPGP